MSGEGARRHSYVRTRILISTDDIFDSPFEDISLVLTGAELNLLRNLTQYLGRRSTFVSEYYGDYYLEPTDEDWDTLDAIVAELEYKLMGGEE